MTKNRSHYSGGKNRHECTFCNRKRNEDKMVYITYRLLHRGGYICKDHLSAEADIFEVVDPGRKPVFLELFSGSGTVAKLAKERGFDTVTVDIESRFNPDICIDILNLRRSTLPGSVDIVWASIPCQVYSVMSLAHHWNKTEIGYRKYWYTPKTDRAQQGLKILNKTLELIVRLQPLYYFIENPRGALRHMPQMTMIPYQHTVSYGDYGFDYYKPTDLWHNNPKFKPKPIKGCIGKSFPRSVEMIETPTSDP